MTHTLIIGQTMSGKTTLAVKISEIITKTQDRPKLVLDPNLDPRWNADFITDDAEKFRQIVKENTGCELIIDEGGETIGRYSKEMMFLGTRARHWGHRSTFICQRATQIDRNIRDQCSNIFAFSISVNDAKIFAEDFVDKKFLECPTLGVGQCISKTRFKKARLLNVFDM